MHMLTAEELVRIITTDQTDRQCMLVGIYTTEFDDKLEKCRRTCPIAYYGGARSYDKRGAWVFGNITP